MGNKTVSDAYAAGFDAGKNGAHIGNSLFRFFLTDELTDAWERGYKAGQHEKATAAGGDNLSPR